MMIARRTTHITAKGQEKVLYYRKHANNARYMHTHILNQLFTVPCANDILLRNFMMMYSVYSKIYLYLK